MLSIAAMLGDTSAQTFLEENFQRLPRSGQFPLEAIETCDLRKCIVSAMGVREADVMICRRNSNFSGEAPTTEAGIEALREEGFTFVIRHAERWNAALRALAANFERDFAAPVNIHLYSTPAGEFGFGWHYDAEEVFILQTEGEKTYELRKNTVNPWPVEEALPQDMRYEREIMPLWKCPLAAGDWLYIPSGYWHRAKAVSASTSIALGVRPLTGLDIWDYLRTTLASDLVWRQRLPPTGAIQTDRGAVSSEVQRCIELLRSEANRLFANPKLSAELIRQWQRCELSVNQVSQK